VSVTSIEWNILTEGDLIEIENRTAKLIHRSETLLRTADPYADWGEQIDQFRADFRILVDLAREQRRRFDEVLSALGSMKPTPKARPKHKKAIK
jgi:hypothetical protein